MRYLPLALVVAVFAMAAGPARGPSWQELKSPECGFRAEMPGEPRKLSERAEPGIEIRRFLVADPSSGLNFIVCHFRLTDELLKEKSSPDQRLEFLREGTLAGHKLTSRKRIATPGGAGEQLEIRTADGGSMLVRQFAIGRSIYQCGVGGPAPAVQAHAKAVDRFFASFALLAGTSPDNGTQQTEGPFTSAEEGFRAAFPATPKRKARTSKAGPSAQYLATDQQRNIVYLVDCVRLDPAIVARFGKPEEVLDRLLGGLVGDGKLLRQRRITLGNYPGRGVEIEKSDKLILVARVFLAEGCLYQAAVGGAAQAMKENIKNTRNFLDSFAIVSPLGEATDGRGWRELVCTEGGFRVLLPGSPRGEAKVTKKGHPHFEYHLTDSQTNARYLIDFGPLPEEAVEKNAPPNQVLDAFQTRLVGKGKLLAEKAIALAAHPGRELEIAGAEGGRVRARLYVIGSHIYQCLITVPANSSAVASSDAQKFLDSFLLIAD